MTRRSAYVGIGSNVDPERHVRAAVAALGRRFGRVRCSAVYRTQAVGFEGPDFYNLAASFDTDLSCASLVAALREVEACNGRDRRSPRFGDRTIDVDLLLYGDLVRESDPPLPRPELLESAFVLGPLAELAPALRHPVDGRPLGELWSALAPRAAPLRPVPLDLVASA